MQAKVNRIVAPIFAEPRHVEAEARIERDRIQTQALSEDGRAIAPTGEERLRVAQNAHDDCEHVKSEAHAQYRRVTGDDHQNNNPAQGSVCDPEADVSSPYCIQSAYR